MRWRMGFAVISSDAGHAARTGPIFGIDPQARLDYGYQAVAKLTPMAKAVIQTAYGKGPDRSYFGGCSNGGRHTMVAAARYADQYDGFLAGDPGFRLPLAALANIAGAPGLQRGRHDTRPTRRPASRAAERTLVAERRARQVRRARRRGRRPGAGHQGLPGGLRPEPRRARPAPARATAPACRRRRRPSSPSASPARRRAPARSSIRAARTTPASAAATPAFWNFTAPPVLDSGAVGIHLASAAGDRRRLQRRRPSRSTGNIDTMLAKIQATNAHLHRDVAVSS